MRHLRWHQKYETFKDKPDKAHVSTVLTIVEKN